MCSGTEDIEHMAFHCPNAQKIRKAVATEWWARTNDAQWAIPHTFKEAFLGPKAKTPLEVAWLTLNSITTWHIWKIRCAWTYDRKKVIHVALTANAIWHDFESVLVARCNKSLKQLEKITEEFKLSCVFAEREELFFPTRANNTSCSKRSNSPYGHNQPQDNQRVLRDYWSR